LASFMNKVAARTSAKTFAGDGYEWLIDYNRYQRIVEGCREDLTVSQIYSTKIQVFSFSLEFLCMKRG